MTNHIKSPFPSGAAMAQITHDDFGTVTRVVGDSLAYLVSDAKANYSFGPAAVEGYRGQSLSELAVSEGVRVKFKLDGAGRVQALAVVAEQTEQTKQAEESFPGLLGERDIPAAKEISKGFEAGGVFGRNRVLQLDPADRPVDFRNAFRALPKETRRFGKLVDPTNLRPGDLVLTREITPDRISSLITDVQVQGGYDPVDSEWTHAAMYLGDGASVVEATFDSIYKGGDVRITSLDQYSQGNHALRFRRSQWVKTAEEGWLVCLRALSRLKEAYDLLYAAQMWLAVSGKRKGFFSPGRMQSTSSAVICSTLYADAHNEATRRTLGELNGICVPAWLSATEHFTDISAGWIGIS